MRLYPLLAFAALLTMLPMTATLAQDTPPTEEPLEDGVSLAIYNQGTALVQDRRSFRIQEGTTQIDFTDVASQIDATSVTFVSLTDPENTYVLEQNFVYDLVGSSALYERYLDQEIVITLSDGTEFSGTLLSARDGNVIIQRPRDNAVILLSMGSIRDVRFPSLPNGLITRPTLRWLVNSPTTGNQQVALTYLTGGINWTADYNLLLNTDNSALDLNGWVTLTNTSGTSYNNALVKLIAGDVNRLPEPQIMMEADMLFRAEAAPMADAGTTQREFFEYQLYEINRRVTVGNNETKQVEFVSGTNVPAQTFYVYNGGAPFYGYNYPIQDNGGYGNTGVTTVQNFIEFSTDADGGLGADLPAGRVRVYQQDVDGAALLIGENSINHTPEGEDVQLYLGNAFDLVGEHVQTDFQIISSNVIEETFRIELRNRKDTDTVEIRVPENMYRWSNWEVVESSDPFEKLNSNQIEFRVQVEPQTTRVIIYKVRYTFPR